MRFEGIDDHHQYFCVGVFVDATSFCEETLDGDFLGIFLLHGNVGVCIFDFDNVVFHLEVLDGIMTSSFPRICGVCAVELVYVQRYV